MEFEEKRDMVYELLDLLKENKLNEVQKQTIKNIVKGLKNRTEKQKERFYMFYNLLESENKNYRLCDMAELYNCTSSCIKFSISRIRNNLINADESNLAIMKKILNEYHNKN